MRAQSIHDRAVQARNSYRYQRALADDREKKECAARSKKWDDFYRKALPNPEKDNKND